MLSQFLSDNSFSCFPTRSQGAILKVESISTGCDTKEMESKPKEGDFCPMLKNIFNQTNLIVALCTSELEKVLIT